MTEHTHLDDAKKLTHNDIDNISEDDLPLAVLSFNHRSFISSQVAFQTKGQYNHFMWMHRSGYFASQQFSFKEVPISKFFKVHDLVFWHDPSWRPVDRWLLIARIEGELGKPWYETSYDFLGFIGHGFGIPWFQDWSRRICSEHAEYLKLIDPNFNLKNPSPNDLDRWFRQQKNYQVYGWLEYNGGNS